MSMITSSNSPPSKLAESTKKPLSETQQAVLLSGGLIYSKEDKDTLAYEHDRQAHKKTLDRARNKARKAFGWGSSTSNRNSSRARGGANGTGQQQGSEAKRIIAGEEDRELAAEYVPSSERNKTSREVIKALEDQDTTAFWRGTPFAEVRLADLVLQAASESELKGGGKKAFGSGRSHKKLRGGVLGQGGLDGEFEVIPHMRSVIVLDEQQFPVGLDLLGDPWECVEDESSSGASGGEEVEGKAKATYAKVAAAGMMEK